MKKNDRLWDILIVACLAVLAGIGVCVVLLFPEKPATVTVDSVPVRGGTVTGEPAGETGAEALRTVPAVTGTRPAGQDPGTLTVPKAENNDLNAADESALQRVSGVGAVLAGRICAFRDEIGGFTRRAQLLEIEGIGEKLAERIMDEFYIPDELPPETTAPQTTAENRTTAAVTKTTGTAAGTTASKTTAASAAETEPVLPPKRNINTVTEAELLEIPGMNETRAATIIKMREQLGGFRDLHELTYCEGLSADYIVNTLFEYLSAEEAEASAEP